MNKLTALLLFLFPCALFAQLQQSSALLEVESTEAGILIPRMTVMQRDSIANPATGLQGLNSLNQPNGDCVPIYQTRLNANGDCVPLIKPAIMPNLVGAP